MSDQLDKLLTQLHQMLTEIEAGQRMVVNVDETMTWYLESQAANLLAYLQQTTERVDAHYTIERDDDGTDEQTSDLPF